MFCEIFTDSTVLLPEKCDIELAAVCLPPQVEFDSVIPSACFMPDDIFMYIGHASFITVLPSFRATREAKTFQPGPSFLFGRIPRRKLRRFRENRCPPGKTVFGKTKRIHGVILNRGFFFRVATAKKRKYLLLSG